MHHVYEWIIGLSQSSDSVHHISVITQSISSKMLKSETLWIALQVRGMGCLNSLRPSDAYMSPTWDTIGYDNGLSPGRGQAIIWTSAGILLIGSLGTNLNEILIEMHIFSFKEIHLKMLSEKCRPFCLCFNVLREVSVWSLLQLSHYSAVCQGWGQFLFFNSIPIPIPLRSIPIPIPIPLGWKIAIPIQIPFYQFQFLFINSFSIPF